MLRYCLPLALLPLLASCTAPRQAAAPRPLPAPLRTAAPVPVPALVVERYAGDWSVAELTQGDWYWRHDGGADTAIFSADGTEPLAMLSCAAGMVRISRAGAAEPHSATITLRTSFAERSLTAQASAGAPPMLTAILPARDMLFDQIIYSRGRFVIEASRQPPLILPTRPEIARVVEDCRG